MQNRKWGGPDSSTPRRGRWSQAEIALLRERYGKRDDDAIARELGRSVSSVQRMAQKVFAGEPRRGPWSPAEIERLRRYLGGTTVEVIALVLCREPEQVEEQIEALGRVRRTGPWGAEELAELKRLYGTRTDEDLSKILSRSCEAIRAKAEDLCLAKDKGFLRRLHGHERSSHMPRWSSDELQLLRTLYADHSNLEIAQRLDRSVKSVVSKAHHLGLRKDAERLREMGRQNVSRRYSRSDGRRARGTDE